MSRILVVVLALFLGGCRPQYSDFFPYFEDGTPKPHVALLPVIDECHPSLQWDLSKEFTVAVRNQLKTHGTIFVPSQMELSKQVASCSQKDLVSQDLMPFLFFQPAHFVVVMELIEFKMVPYEPGKIKPLYTTSLSQSDAQVLQMKVRLRIVDIRGGEPKLIRQEVVESNHMITRGAYDESLALHGTDGYAGSALGLAEGRLIRTLSDKIEHITAYQR